MAEERRRVRSLFRSIFGCSAKKNMVSGHSVEIINMGRSVSSIQEIQGTFVKRHNHGECTGQCISDIRVSGETPESGNKKLPSQEGQIRIPGQCACSHSNVGYSRNWENVPKLEHPKEDVWQILVTSCSANNEIFINLVENIADLSRFTQDMNQYYENTQSCFYGASVLIDHALYVARMQVKKEVIWRRVFIIGIIDQEIDVFCVDTGEITFVHVKQLRHLSQKHETFPFQAVRMNLFGFEEEQEKIPTSILKRILVGRVVKASIQDRGQEVSAVLFVTSGEERIDVNMMIAEEALSRASNYEFGPSFPGRVSQTHEDGVIYFQYEGPFANLLEKELQRINKQLEASKLSSIELMNEDIKHAVKHEGVWQRVIVLEKLDVQERESENKEN